MSFALIPNLVRAFWQRIPYGLKFDSMIRIRLGDELLQFAAPAPGGGKPHRRDMALTNRPLQRRVVLVGLYAEISAPGRGWPCV
jgi:hypothetical protein